MRALLALTVALAVGCSPGTSTPDVCADLATRCGGANAQNWLEWCRGECVPEHARTVACDLNAECVLCDAPRDDGSTIYFALPADELEYLWTSSDDQPEPVHPASEPGPTGLGFVDDGDFSASAWRAYEPFAALAPYAPDGFCEPGPNRFLAERVVRDTSGLVLSAQRMPSEPMPPDAPPYCAGGMCGEQPYVACDAPATACQYREPPYTSGLGYASQADRSLPSGEPLTYGYGSYRATALASGATGAAEPGFVYAFYVQGNAPCVAGEPNLDTNTSEIDVEIVSGTGTIYARPFCTADQMCVQFTNWVSSTQGIPRGAGILRSQESAFRFRDRGIASAPRTYGFDWQPTEVRFTYDRDPHDCDERSASCGPAQRSLALCRHERFVPRRPSPLHVQLWPAWWAGPVARGTSAEMRFERIWHEPG